MSLSAVMSQGTSYFADTIVTVWEFNFQKVERALEQ